MYQVDLIEKCTCHEGFMLRLRLSPRYCIPSHTHIPLNTWRPPHLEALEGLYLALPSSLPDFGAALGLDLCSLPRCWPRRSTMINLFHFPGLLLGLFCTPFLAAQSAQFTSTECIVYTVYTVYILKGSIILLFIRFFRI